MKAQTEPNPFLTAEWRHLVMANYEVDSEWLTPWVPPGTAIDGYQGKVYVSLVGFLFLNTRLKGFPVPWHQDFEEVNLRFYVRRHHPEGWRRGVVFIREIVPRIAVAKLAQWLYGERYVSMPMRHEIQKDSRGDLTAATYQWCHDDKWNTLAVKVENQSTEPKPGSLDSFIAEHYWGYSRLSNGGCMEYRVDHSPWKLRQIHQYSIDVGGGSLCVEPLSRIFQSSPASVFLAEGSPVTVRDGVRIC